jgi:hypothetical protein
MSPFTYATSRTFLLINLKYANPPLARDIQDDMAMNFLVGTPARLVLTEADAVEQSSTSEF